MSITDELREFASHCAGGMGGDSLRHIADHIDAEHERGMADAELAAAPTEAQLDELGYVKLPVDADGVPIRFGDKVTVSWSEKVYEVSGFSYTQQLAGGKRTIWVDVYSREKMGNVPLCGSSSCRHYHAPAVENVLREFAFQIGQSATDDAIVAEYAQRLQLREVDE